MSNPHLICRFKTNRQTDGGIEEESSSGSAFVVPEVGKKSSYLLEMKDQEISDENHCDEDSWCHHIATPAELVIENATDSAKSKQPCHFCFGGLQVVFSAKHIEVYLTPPGGKESYLMTCRAIPYKAKETDNDLLASSKSTDMFRAICVVPGGPRNISRLRIKLVESATPGKERSEFTKIFYMKVTARIEVAVNSPPPTTEAAPSTLPNSSAQPQKSQRYPFKPYVIDFNPIMGGVNATTKTEKPLTESDLGAAMAGLSFMARKAEQNMLDTFQKQSQQVEKFMQSSFQQLGLHLNVIHSTLATQNQVMKENQTILQQQRDLISHQNQQIGLLLKENETLKERTQSLLEELILSRSNGKSDPTFLTTTDDHERYCESDILNANEEIIGTNEDELVSSFSAPSPTRDVENGDGREVGNHSSTTEVSPTKKI